MLDITVGDVPLSKIFHEVNQVHFDGVLPEPLIKWNPRLRSSAGRFHPGGRSKPRMITIVHFRVEVPQPPRPPMIEIASYLLEEAQSHAHIKDTMAHEMIHYWLWVRKRPYGHTPEFWRKMQEMGVNRYNPVPRTRPYKYIYRCTSCSKEFPARKRLGPLACARCCKAYSDGKYDSRFRLVLDRSLADGEKWISE